MMYDILSVWDSIHSSYNAKNVLQKEKKTPFRLNDSDVEITSQSTFISFLNQHH